MFKALKDKILELYQSHEKALEIGFFVGGFIFDIVMMSEVDDLFSLGQQIVYLLVIASILHFEILFRLRKWKPKRGFIIRLWQYRSLILHFLLGSLLSLYSLFYIKSASLVSSLFFLGFMLFLLVSNELPFLKKAKVSFKVGLYVICLFSFFSILYPIILGYVGWTPFGLSMITTLVALFLQIKWIKKALPDEKTLFKAIFVPGFSVITAFAVFYFLGWIPPVPLSAKTQGIYHAVEKKEGVFYLSEERPWWRFWHSGDQLFQARDGDKIYYYVQIYSPARFSDQIYVKWFYKDVRLGWQPTDKIPLIISGGREEGYRAWTSKANYQPGQWRVHVETSMGHEISRMGFEVVTDNSITPREFRVIEKR